MGDVGNANKKTKKRKSYFRFIQRNIEFYMSDANLRRDSYLRKHLGENLDIDLSVFLNFNRIRELGADIEDVKTALRPSQLLELVDGKTVRRKSAVVEKSKEEIDSCSLYVERLPPDTTPESLAKVFSTFGKVVMVSIPRYKTSKMVKGYGFIEFENKSSCAAAMQKFASYGGILGGEQGALSCRKCLGQISEHDTENNYPAETEMKEVKAEPEKPEVLVAKELPTASEEKIKEEEESHPKQELKQLKKRKRNRKKKKWQRKLNYTYLGFQIMTKVVWNQWRDRYLSLQAANRRCMKVQLAKLKRPMNRPPQLKALVPGSVVSMTSQKSISESEAKALKTNLRQLESVEYVDIEPGHNNGYIRLTTPEAASWLVTHAAEVLPSCKVEILPPSAEDLYWIKIEHDRQNKLIASKSKRKIGGGKKIMMRAEKQLGVIIRLNSDEIL